LPKNLNGKQKSALKAFAEAMGDSSFKATTEPQSHTERVTEDHHKEDKGFFGKMKDAFSVD
jgi:hypothetical protein